MVGGGGGGGWGVAIGSTVLLLIYGRDGKDFEIRPAINVWEEKDSNL